MRHREEVPTASPSPHLVPIDEDSADCRPASLENTAALSALLLDIYAFAERRATTDGFCTSLAHYLGCAHVGLLRLTRSGRRDRVLALVANGAVWGASTPSGASSESLRSQLERLRFQDFMPGAGACSNSLVGLTGTESATSSMVLGLVAAHEDCRYLLCLEWRGPESRPAVLTSQLQLLLPHVRQALRLRDVTDEFRARVLVDANVLNRAPSGVLVLTAAGSIEYANEEAEHILAENEGLSRVGSALVIDNLKLRGVLNQSLSELRTVDDHGSLEARSIQVTRSSGSPPYIVTLLPVVVTGDDSFLAPRRRLLTVVSNAVPRRLPGVGYLQRTFGMTPAEARVCRALCNGEETEAVAQALAISVATAKSHLMRIYQKLEVNSRARLVQRLQGHYWVEKPIVVEVDSVTQGLPRLGTESG